MTDRIGEVTVKPPDEVKTAEKEKTIKVICFARCTTGRDSYHRGGMVFSKTFAPMYVLPSEEQYKDKFLVFHKAIDNESWSSELFEMKKFKN